MKPNKSLSREEINNFKERDEKRFKELSLEKFRLELYLEEITEDLEKSKISIQYHKNTLDDMDNMEKERRNKKLK